MTFVIVEFFMYLLPQFNSIQNWGNWLCCMHLGGGSYAIKKRKYFLDCVITHKIKNYNDYI